MLLCGIDEAGRGSIAGPLVVAGVVLLEPIDGLRDSKKLSQSQREKLYSKIIKKSKYHIVIKSNIQIDTQGLSLCIKESLEEIVANMDKCDFLFDGNSNFGAKNIKTQVRADTVVDEVKAASIVAKVTKDNFLDNVIGYEKYNFHSNKGYGTKSHKELVARYGLSDLHRKSYKLKGVMLDYFSDFWMQY